MSLKSKIRKIIPEWAISFYHFLLAFLAGIFYGYPSKKMVVIGITGTKGKTSTANFIWSCLTAGGIKTGLIGTANIRIGEKELLNKFHMTMLGRFKLQKLMKQMVKEGCKYCVMEVTSEGIKQWRHKGIIFDVAVFTNLTPEHLQSHGGSFEKYKEAKGKLFESLNLGKRKIINNKKINKIIIANYDSEHKDYYLNFNADKKITYGLKNGADYKAVDVKNTYDGVSFNAGSSKYILNILGNFNVYNALPAIIISKEMGFSDEIIDKGFKNLKIIPGRMEKIDKGQNFTVIVDYAHEKQSINGVLDTANEIRGESENKIIILLGAEGGGRDKSKRSIMGEIAAKKADYVIVSNVDPYEDDPKEIAEDIAKSSEKNGKIRDKDLFVIEDRREGIKKALSLAKEKDIVLITGKGAEQSIVIGGKSSPWDDRKVVAEEMTNMLK